LWRPDQTGPSSNAASRALRRADTPTRAALGGPFAETAEHWITTGVDEDLDKAARKAARSALASLGAAVDLRISQVDLVKGVHCTLPKELSLD
jgi:hypothetical protein